MSQPSCDIIITSKLANVELSKNQKVWVNVRTTEGYQVAMNNSVPSP